MPECLWPTSGMGGGRLVRLPKRGHERLTCRTASLFGPPCLFRLARVNSCNLKGLETVPQKMVGKRITHGVNCKNGANSVNGVNCVRNARPRYATVFQPKWSTLVAPTTNKDSIKSWAIDHWECNRAPLTADMKTPGKRLQVKALRPTWPQPHLRGCQGEVKQTPGTMAQLVTSTCAASLGRQQTSFQ